MKYEKNIVILATVTLSISFLPVMAQTDTDEAINQLIQAQKITNAREDIFGGGDVEKGIQRLKTPQDGLAIWGDRLEIVIADLYVECVSMKEKNEIPASEKCIKWARDGANILLN